ncbi:unnamed protein product [Bursaphelenchus okinawaensis]|uniref:Renin receptor-like C-terminal transmembrane spanning segment domain-containing protein n=1 Tax=Bursaphelenchus okinawaensis TaxID=465554 RepID=A0A811LK96_9BILA|nr:unnamed protein product [Bursaphelenchus okinawaensis]CAG9125277.1 unnamed protein product [Bursaphelenchus okinawaensis]
MMHKIAVFFLVTVAFVSMVHAQQEEDPVMKKRKDFGVYSFVSSDYPAAFAIVAGVSVVLVVGVVFIVVGLLTMDPGRDSIIYRMTTTRMKKD